MCRLRRLDPFSLYPTSLFIFVDYILYIQLNINLITKYTKKIKCTDGPNNASGVVWACFRCPAFDLSPYRVFCSLQPMYIIKHQLISTNMKKIKKKLTYGRNNTSVVVWARSPSRRRRLPSFLPLHILQLTIYTFNY